MTINITQTQVLIEKWFSYKYEIGNIRRKPTKPGCLIMVFCTMDDGVNDKPDNVVILILNLFLPKTDELK